MAAVVHNQHNLLFSACLLWKTKVADKFLLSNRGRDNFRIRGTFTHYHLFLGGGFSINHLSISKLSGKLNSVRYCFGHQLAEMIEKLTVRPKDFVYLDRVIKAFGRDRASAQKQRRLTRRLRDHVFSREDLIGFRVRADSGSQLHRPSKQIVIVLNRFAHAQTNPQVQGRAGILNIISGERPLNGYRAFQRLVDRSKRRHDSVA